MKNRELTPEKIEHWAKMPSWYAREAALICCGYDPDCAPPVKETGKYEFVSVRLPPMGKVTLPTIQVSKEYTVYMKKAAKAESIIKRANLANDLPSISSTRKPHKKILFRPKEVIRWANETVLVTDLPELFLEILPSLEPANIPAPPIPKLQMQIDAILHAANSLGYDPLCIPRGGKGKVKSKCMEILGLFSENSFKKAWQAARGHTPQLIEVENPEIYKK